MTRINDDMRANPKRRVQSELGNWSVSGNGRSPETREASRHFFEGGEARRNLVTPRANGALQLRMASWCRTYDDEKSGLKVSSWRVTSFASSSMHPKLFSRAHHAISNKIHWDLREPVDYQVIACQLHASPAFPAFPGPPEACGLMLRQSQGVERVREHRKRSG